MTIGRLTLPNLTNQPDRFEVDGKVSSFPLARFRAEADFEDAHIMTELIAAVIAKLPGS